MRPFAPDKNDPFPKIGHNNGGGNGPRPQFMPGQINNIANDLQMGYGGDVDKMKAYLKGVYEPVSLGGGFNFGGGGRGNGNPRGMKDGTGFNFDGGVNVHPSRAMAMQAPQQGLLNAPMQQTQQTQQQGLLGDIPPEVLQYLNMRR